jgi:hypothetical protein
MPYNKNNKNKRNKYILDVYKSVKQEDIADTFIVRNLFPKHGIFISYRAWMEIKGMKPSQMSSQNQLSLF